jgi:hypothetical protein
MADQRGDRQGFTPDDTDRSGWVCVPALSAVNGEDFGPDIPLGFDPVGAPGIADSRALRRRGDRVVGLGGVPWIFGGAHDAQTATGGVVVVADTTPVSAPPPPCRTPPGSPCASTKNHGTPPSGSRPQVARCMPEAKWRRLDPADAGRTGGRDH